ncbi:hypothetical protein ABW19_dt0205299 [Dactylella cylindrospora]|nr:hypothetical protein ABW19_dt0205299 [Dactylella cylindrospora]
MAYQLNCIWRHYDRSKVGVIDLTGNIRYHIYQNYFTLEELEDCWIYSIAGLMKQLYMPPRTAWVRLIIRSAGEDVHREIERIDKSVLFYREAEESVDRIYSLADAFFARWDVSIERRVVINSIILLWVVHILKAEDGPLRTALFGSHPSPVELREYLDPRWEENYRAMLLDWTDGAWGTGAFARPYAMEWFKMVLLALSEGDVWKKACAG